MIRLTAALVLLAPMLDARPALAGIFDGCQAGYNNCMSYAARRALDAVERIAAMCEDVHVGCRAAAAYASTGRGGFNDVWIFPGGAVVYIYPGGLSVLAIGGRRPG